MTDRASVSDAAPALGVGDGEISAATRRWALGVLFVIFAFNYIDRSVIGVLGQVIQAEMRLADWQVGVLGGLAFAICNTIAGIPIARLADRYSRVTILSVCLGLWSIMTALCGTAASFWSLFLYRGGVGVGEAAGTPTSHSLIADYYPPQKRATALALFSLGIPAGVFIGSAAGGWLAQAYGWREAFIVLGVPGVLLAIFAKMTLKEPQRGYWDAPPAKAAEATQTPSLMAVIRTLCASRTLVHLMIGMTIASFASAGMKQFTPPFYTRLFGLDYAQVGMVDGVVSGVGVGIGMLIGGFGTDWFGRRDRRWYAWLPAIGLLLATPGYLFAYYQSTWLATALLMVVPTILGGFYLAPVFALLHNAVEPRMRATTVALMAVLLNLIGLGFGPPFVGFLVDLVSQHLYGLHNMADSLDAHCRGSGLTLDAVCRDALGNGTRYALALTSLLKLWAGLHFIAAAWAMKARD